MSAPSEAVVRVDHLSKRFKLYDRAWDRLADWLWLPPRPRFQEFWALRDISFDLRRGECLGIIGPNGAGKTTLLKLLTGALHPTSGALDIDGRVLSLLELGSDFTPDLTGRENVEQSARLLGFSSNWAAERMDEIEAFAELGEYFNRPVKLYSSGMFVRLAFSMFATMEPDVFLVDEALTVGDLRFSGKALARIREMLDRGTTMLFVSHNLEIVSQLCTRVLWIQAGRVQADGAPREVVETYVQFMVHGGIQPTMDTGSATREAAPRSDSAEMFATQVDKLYLGEGWYPLEAYAGQVFCWAQPHAELVLDPSLAERELLLELEPGPGATLPMALRVLNIGLDSLAEFSLSGRETIRVSLPPAPNGPLRLRLQATGAERTAPGDDRQLVFRAFRWGWSDPSQLQSIQTSARWRDEETDAELNYELAAMEAALARDKPVTGTPARITRVVTRNQDGTEAVRFQTYDETILEVTVEALADVSRLIVGASITDVFDRELYRTRSDLQTEALPGMQAGESITVVFSCPRLALGHGLYQLSIGICGPGLWDEVWHLVLRAWAIQVINPAGADVFGPVDLDWRYLGERVAQRARSV